MRNVLLACLLLAGLSACGGSSDSNVSEQPAQTASVEAANDPAPTTDSAEPASANGAVATTSDRAPVKAGDGDSRPQTQPADSTPTPAGDEPRENIEPETLPELAGEEVKVGQVYTGEKRLKVSVYGVSFNLPAGLATGIAAGSPAFQVEGTDRPSLGFIAMKRETTVAEVKREMAQAQDFGDGIVLHLQGAVDEKDGRLSAWYGDGMYVAQCVARISEHGNGVAFLFGAETSQRSWVERSVKALIDSVEFQQPQESQDEQQWKQLLSGHKLTYLRSHYSSDYGGSTSSSTREEISLGADGSFHYYFLDTFTIGARGGTGIGRTPDEDNGSWSIESIGAATQLVLKGAKERRYNLAYAGEKIYLNGKHFFRTQLQ